MSVIQILYLCGLFVFYSYLFVFSRLFLFLWDCLCGAAWRGVRRRERRPRPRVAHCCAVHSQCHTIIAKVTRRRLVFRKRLLNDPYRTLVYLYTVEARELQLKLNQFLLLHEQLYLIRSIFFALTMVEFFFF